MTAKKAPARAKTATGTARDSKLVEPKDVPDDLVTDDDDDDLDTDGPVGFDKLDVDGVDDDDDDDDGTFNVLVVPQSIRENEQYAPFVAKISDVRADPNSTEISFQYRGRDDDESYELTTQQRHDLTYAVKQQVRATVHPVIDVDKSMVSEEYVEGVREQRHAEVDRLTDEESTLRHQVAYDENVAAEADADVHPADDDLDHPTTVNSEE